jgi:hypothetical protein
MTKTRELKSSLGILNEKALVQTTYLFRNSMLLSGTDFVMQIWMTDLKAFKKH